MNIGVNQNIINTQAQLDDAATAYGLISEKTGANPTFVRSRLLGAVVEG